MAQVRVFKGVVRRLENRLRKTLQGWSLRRNPRGQQLTLTQKRIYILPSAAGCMFVLLLGVMLLLGINYQNNLAYAVTFLLSSLFVVTIIHTYANLSGITITFIKGHACFAGEAIAFELQLSACGQRCYENIQLCWEQGESLSVDLLDTRAEKVVLYAPASQRGLQKAGVLLIETLYPLGLFRAWTWLDADLQAVVYPKPVAGGRLPLSGEGGEGMSGERPGQEEFAGLTQYQPGMPLQHIAWKHYARGLGLHTKAYVEESDRRRWLCWHFWPELGTEARLSRLAYWALQLDKQGEVYGLRLPGIELTPNRGARHRHKVLTALALFSADVSGSKAL